MIVLGAAQFLMVLDSAVMAVSMTTLVKEFDTPITTIQAVITLYSLVMAALMITGGRVGDVIGRRRAFTFGMVLYGIGSALTAVAWSVGILALGWSVLEGVGAALVMPAVVALVAANFDGRERAAVYGLLGGIAGAGVAVGPILGGWVTTTFSWRAVFAGEVVVVLVILALVRALHDEQRTGTSSPIDWFGAFLSAAGLSMIVLGILQGGSWGWIADRSSPVTPFGFALTPFVVLGGAIVLYGFVAWQRHLERTGRVPLVHLDLLKINGLRTGVSMLLAQNLILMGVFFVIPLYLQVVQGFDALQTGLRMVPVSATLLVTSIVAARFSGRLSPRLVVNVGLAILLVGTIVLLALVNPRIDNPPFLLAMGMLGIGLGLIASQLTNVVQSAVSGPERGEAGGIQVTAEQLGSALGTALVGAIVISSLAGTLQSQVLGDARISPEVQEQVHGTLVAGVPFVPTRDVEAAADDAGITGVQRDAIVEQYADAQLQALRSGLLLAALIILVAFAIARRLPGRDVAAPART